MKVMKRAVPLVLFLVLLSTQLAAACTSFAVYFYQPVYGVNFDYYPETELSFGIVTDDERDRKLFAMSAAYQHASRVSAVMTTAGEFAALQEQSPPGRGRQPRSRTTFSCRKFCICT